MKHQPSVSTMFSPDFERKIHQGDAADSTSRVEIAHGVEDSDSNVQYILYPNWWARIRDYIKEPAAEFFGTMILMIFGLGVNCQVGLSASKAVADAQHGNYLSISFGWAVGAALAIWTCGGISGGHINPSVTLSFAIFRGFPWKKVPIYWAAQILGSLCGSGLVYANYYHAINLFEGGSGIRTVPGTASLFATYPLDYMTSGACFFDEFLSTMMLLIVILAATDKANMATPPGMLPVAVFILILGIGACFGMQTGYAINPARDLGPRIMTAMAGYGKEVFTFRNQYWLWCPIIATALGAIVGCFIYDTFLFTGPESIINLPNASVRALHEQAHKSARVKIPTPRDIV